MLRHCLIGSCLLLAGSFAATPACAAVAEADASHLLLRYELPVKAAPARAYAATVDIARWWSAEHTYSGDAGHLHLDAKAGGCWCERWKGGSVEHMHVVMAMPGQMLRLRGALGPLQSGAVDGTLTFEFKHTGDASAITVSYLISGYFAGGLDKLAQGVDGVLGAQMKRLQRFVDGAPVAATEAH